METEKAETEAVAVVVEEEKGYRRPVHHHPNVEWMALHNVQQAVYLASNQEGRSSTPPGFHLQAHRTVHPTLASAN